MTRKNAITHLAHKIIGCKCTGESKADGVNVVALEMATTALEEQETGKWNPLKTRPMDEEEREEWSSKLGYKLEDYEAVIYMPPLPDEGQEVLICLRNGSRKTDTFTEDEYGGYFFEYDIDKVVAWMPLPEPWKGEEND
jgi:hypothetical protein